MSLLSILDLSFLLMDFADFVSRISASDIDKDGFARLIEGGGPTSIN